MLARTAVHAALQRIDRCTSTINNLASREAPRNCRAPWAASRRYTSCCLSVDICSLVAQWDGAADMWWLMWRQDIRRCTPFQCRTHSLTHLLVRL